MRNKGKTTHREGGPALEEMHSEAVGSSSLQVFKIQQDKDMSDLI